MENIRKPQILIQTDGITNTKIFIDGKELPGVAGVRFSQSYKENKGLPVLQIELKATNVTLDAKMLPALPEPYKGQYISISRLLSIKVILFLVTPPVHPNLNLQKIPSSSKAPATPP